MGAGVRCTGCGQVKPRSEFGADSRRASGLRARCNPCRAAEERAARARRAKDGPRRLAAVVDLPARPVPPPAPRAVPSPPALPAAASVDPEGSYRAECERTLATLELGDGDAAAASVARGLARAMDAAFGDARELAVLAPKYLQALAALRATRASQVEAAQKVTRRDAANY